MFTKEMLLYNLCFYSRKAHKTTGDKKIDTQTARFGGGGDGGSLFQI